MTGNDDQSSPEQLRFVAVSFNSPLPRMDHLEARSHETTPQIAREIGTVKGEDHRVSQFTRAQAGKRDHDAELLH